MGAARALSGLSVWDRADRGTGLDLGTFRYREDWHYRGPVAGLGVTPVPGWLNRRFVGAFR